MSKINDAASIDSVPQILKSIVLHTKPKFELKFYT